ncbi:hypothetical protein RUM44_009400 [Polyplax serrata]|uniref:Uncharacterized protein n=1 Tax=Polyplax serrata TaxID=468196 RepID=A0ABR1ASK7_POLSC
MRYLDRYRDPRDISQRFLLRKLKETNPFEPPKKPFPYGRALRSPYKNLPFWLKKEEIRYRAGIGRIQNQERDEYE